MYVGVIHICLHRVENHQYFEKSLEELQRCNHDQDVIMNFPGLSSYHLSAVLRYACKAVCVKQNICCGISHFLQDMVTCRMSKTKWFPIQRSDRIER